MAILDFQRVAHSKSIPGRMDRTSSGSSGLLQVFLAWEIDDILARRKVHSSYGVTERNMGLDWGLIIEHHEQK